MTLYDVMNDDQTYNIYAMSYDRSTAISVGCVIDGVKNNQIIPRATFITKAVFKQDFRNSPIKFQYRVDGKPFVDENFDKLGGSGELQKIVTASPSKISPLISNLHDGKILSFSFTTDDDDVELQKFDIHGFNEAFEKIKGPCKF